MEIPTFFLLYDYPYQFCVLSHGYNDVHSLMNPINSFLDICCMLVIDLVY